MENTAKVIALRGDMDSLKEAITRGYITGNAARDAAHLIAENERLNNELIAAQRKVDTLEAVVMEHRRTDAEGRALYMARRESDNAERATRRSMIAASVIVGLAVGASVISLVAMSLI